MGGDRDGNPFVTATCTRDVVYLAHHRREPLLQGDSESHLLAVHVERTDAFQERARLLHENHRRRRVRDAQATQLPDFWRSIPMEEPYRVVLAEVRDKLYNTRGPSRGDHGQGARRSTPRTTRSSSPRNQLLEPLMACHQSLIEVGDAAVADGYLLDLIRQVNCFGLSLVKLDIRQESDRHADAMDAITRHRPRFLQRVGRGEEDGVARVGAQVQAPARGVRPGVHRRRPRGARHLQDDRAPPAGVPGLLGHVRHLHGHRCVRRAGGGCCQREMGGKMDQLLACAAVRAPGRPQRGPEPTPPAFQRARGTTSSSTASRR